MHFRMDAFIARVINENRAQSDLVKDFEHRGRGVGEKICKDRLGEGEVEIRDFQRFRVV